MTMRSTSVDARAGVLRCAVALVIVLGACDPRPQLPPGQEAVESDEAAIAARMVELIRQISVERADGGPLRRFNQAKSLGCLNATLEIPDLAPALAQGIFATPGSYRSRVRFANASESDDREPDLRGLSISVLDARAPDGSRVVQDFLFNSHPALFAADPRAFLAFIEATAKDRLWWYFVNPADSHLRALWILFRARGTPASPFEIAYWSTTPFRYGRSKNVAVKHAMLPCSTAEPAEQEQSGRDRLTAAMQAHLERGDACFEFAVQFQTDPAAMPIEDASRIWPEDQSPLRTVARLTIPPQEFTNEAAMARCETMTFDSWRGIADHQPLGGINRVRAIVYPALAELRTRGLVSD